MREASSGTGTLQDSKTIKMDAKQLGSKEEHELVRVELQVASYLLTK